MADYRICVSKVKNLGCEGNPRVFSRDDDQLVRREEGARVVQSNSRLLRPSHGNARRMDFAHSRSADAGLGAKRKAQIAACWPEASRDQRSADFLQAPTPLVPGGGIQVARLPVGVQLQAGQHLGPEDDAFYFAIQRGEPTVYGSQMSVIEGKELPKSGQVHAHLPNRWTSVASAERSSGWITWQLACSARRRSQTPRLTRYLSLDALAARQSGAVGRHPGSSLLCRTIRCHSLLD